MPLHVSSTCAHHQEVKIALHSLWYHHTYRCDDTRGCVMQFWLPDNEHMCSKHVKAWNKLIVKQKCCASSWLITEINMLRCTVSKTSKKKLIGVELATYNKKDWQSTNNNIKKNNVIRNFNSKKELEEGRVKVFSCTASRIAFLFRSSWWVSGSPCRNK